MPDPTDPPWAKVLSLTSHEFRTPLTVVAGYIRMVLKNRAGPLSDQQRKLLEEAEKSCGRLFSLCTEVSHLASLEAGRSPMNKQATDLQAVVRAAMAELPPMPEREVAVHLELGSEPAPINGDSVRLTQAFGSIIWALRRELVGESGLTIREKRTQGTYELLIGDPETIAALETEPESERQPFDEWRQGGIGLSMLVARRILNAHGAQLHAAPGGVKAGARILFRSA
jgi:K+-sensing histidine kinase KdpD